MNIPEPTTHDLVHRVRPVEIIEEHETLSSLGQTMLTPLVLVREALHLLKNEIRERSSLRMKYHHVHVPLSGTMVQIDIPWEFRLDDLRWSINSYSNRYLKPAASALVNGVLKRVEDAKADSINVFPLWLPEEVTFKARCNDGECSVRILANMYNAMCLGIKFSPANDLSNLSAESNTGVTP